ncbi:LuxR family transcriptional regulator [Kibdelosporangium aridum]|uniref:LuxR family transcriptional regulator n=1 Tax=Kibdelosporangium aridum TaxID=2030 RepID=A0A428Z0D1_KIBAR|nr:LuxR family transcriptional regulator [Kibdelosporangium aridum]RSM77628.1 LuxR family transcriptional regulator [Kibdelosporangium aridum]
MTEPRLTGRDREQAAVAGMLANAERGQGTLVLISGEPGIGKTRLAEHAARIAQDRGFTVLTGQADPLQAGLAYAPIVSALRMHLDSLPAQTSTEMLRSLPDLGRLITDPRLPQPASGGDPALNRTHMFEAVLRLLHLSAPLLLIVDDLHWADDGTIELVHYLGRGTTTSQLVVIGTCRTPTAGRRLTDLATLVRRNGTELALQPLSDTDLASLLADLLGEPPKEHLVREMSLRTKGVPLFVTALASALPEQGPLPAIVRDIVLGRLHALEEPERAILDLIAVAGTSATAEVLGLQPADPALHNLLRQGHIEEHVTGRQLTYRVAHPLYAEVAYAELTESERRKLHAKLAAAIDTGTPETILAAAPHYRGAGELVDTQRAIDIFTAAGKRALYALAAHEAVEYLGRALALARDARPELVPELLDSLGLAYQGSVRLDDAAAVWRERLQIARDESDETRQIQLLVQLAMLESERGNGVAAQSHVDGISQLRGDRDIDYAAMRIAIVARHMPVDIARATYRQLNDLFSDRPDGPSQAIFHATEAYLAVLEHDFGSAHEHFRAAERVGGPAVAEMPALTFAPRRIHAGVSLLLGDIPGAVRLAELTRAENAAFFMPSAVYSMRLLLRTAQYFVGDLPATAAALEGDIDDSIHTGLYRLTTRMYVFRACLLAELGRLDEAAECVRLARTRPAVQDNALDFTWATAEASIAYYSGQPERAPAFDADGFTITDPILCCLRLLSASRAAIAAKDAVAAEAVQRALHATRDAAPMMAALSDRHDGLLQGDAELLRGAARRFESMGAPLLAAQTLLEAAELDPDRDTILRCLDKLQHVKPWFDRARRLTRAQRLERGDGVLTRREAEIVRLVGAGLSNADIAGRLFLSARTVETHLRNSYRKLDITSRLRLAQWALQHDDEL